MRRRKQGVVWLPLDTSNRLGTDEVGALGSDPSALILSQDVPPFSIPVDPTVTLQAVVKDQPQGVGSTETSSLSDLEGSAYRLRRIVGKIFIQLRQFAGEGGNAPKQVFTTVGFMILRVNESGDPLSALTPEQYDVNALDGVRDPWIWRRSWMLGNNGQTDDVPAPDIAPVFPGSNVHYGSALDGPHIDAKTARVVSDEERLFLVWSSIALDGAAQETNQLILVADLRVLATMRKQSGNRRNASR